MNKQVITKINREKGFQYSVDKEGNVIKDNYSWLKDKWTIVVICILILGTSYYFQAKSSKANINNLDNTCEVYLQFKERWLSAHELIMDYDYNEDDVFFSVKILSLFNKNTQLFA